MTISKTCHARLLGRNRNIASENALLVSWTSLLARPVLCPSRMIPGHQRWRATFVDIAVCGTVVFLRWMGVVGMMDFLGVGANRFVLRIRRG
jgi:hypothetical protein